ncbi:MAG: mannose-1-phosphate guanylyltransferase [Flavobacteriales bacterium]
MKNNNYAVIMAGGIGSRFWPMSKASFPKQFLDILGTGETLIQQTFRRLSKLCPQENILIVTNKAYKSLCLDQLSEVLEENILCEPMMKNTAPCITYASFKIAAKNPNANIIVAPSDHLITNEDEFYKVIENCFERCSQTDQLLTLGIQPSRPDTGYGYIQFQDNAESNLEIFKVKTFTEKPNEDLAIQFIDSGDFLWNSGIFIWNTKSILLNIRKYLRDIYDLFEEGNSFYNTEKEEEFINRIYPACKNISIDYGIMEKSENVYVHKANFGWSDLGTWSSLHTHLPLDKNQNGVLGNDIHLYQSKDNIITLPKNKTAIIEGLSGYIIVENDNTLLICRKNSEQEIKSFVSNLKKDTKE